MTHKKSARLDVDIGYLSSQLKRLLDIASPTGFTDTIVRYVCEELDRLGLDYELTRRGAIRARMKGVRREGARAIVSHLDTLGAQVATIRENGRLGLVPIGTWSARFAEGARAEIFSQKGSYRGTILPPKASGHTFGDEVDTAPVGWPYLELRVDAIADSKARVHRLGIEIGDIVAIDPQPEFLDNGFIISRHLDNKAGVAAMLTALKAMIDAPPPPVDVYWLFTIAEEVGQGAAAILLPDIASMVAVDNGTSAPGQNSAEFGVTIAMGDQTGPFDYHLTRKMVDLCIENDIRYQKDVFRYYRSDSASALEAGADVRTALVTFGVDASHGYERIHMHALRSLSELLTAYCRSDVEIRRDRKPMSGLRGFTHQESDPAKQVLTPKASDIPLAEEQT